MYFKHSRSLISKLTEQIKVLGISVSALLICNSILGMLLWHQSGRRDIVLVPPGLTAGATVMQNGVSNSYLEPIARMLVNDRLNVNPSNVIGSNDDLLEFVDPHFYKTFKVQLNVDAKEIIDGKIASSFYVNSVQSRAEDLVVDVGGTLKRWVGERLISAEPKSYELKFSMTGHPLLLTSFKEINNN
jgi:type IV conjugative transfer system protein TraE